ncbi:hypothetical protein [Vibrio marisflavi]|uniref:Uncharacterized protein n=1 Tax=Vibrio marisflavi CECT 7928 TaxID=634439 RepID=A0ABN8DZH6_9VIBR|nr:hypothetical protein [Vibrio marisflavi]CAH0537151.1 hypothetical protein VMF7928_00964 [Vibrio marisflavi CECT 7928]
MKKLLVVNSVIAWAITASVVIWALNHSNNDTDKHMASEYAFDVISQALSGKNSPEDQIKQIKFWQDSGWTAQTGAIKTLCNIDKERLLTLMDADDANQACRLVREGEQIKALTPLAPKS